jgi:hypothetical protein
MSQHLNGVGLPARAKSLAKAFSFLGWLGFWLQVLIGSIPFLLMLYFFAFARSPNSPRSGLPFIQYLTVASMLVMVFTTFWSYRYTRLARRIADPKLCPPAASLVRASWTGVVASTVGILFSVVVTVFEVAHLLIYFLSAPQAGVPVIQTTGGSVASWVSAADIMSLMTLILCLFAEVIVLVFSQWLLFQSTLLAQSADVAEAAAG